MHFKEEPLAQCSLGTQRGGKILRMANCILGTMSNGWQGAAFQYSWDPAANLYKVESVMYDLAVAQQASIQDSDLGMDC
jgi:hypothetical protein